MSLRKPASGFIFGVVSPEQASKSPSIPAMRQFLETPDMEEVQKLNFLPPLKNEPLK